MNTYLSELHHKVEQTQLFTVSLAATSEQCKVSLTHQFPEYDIHRTQLILPGQIAIIDAETWESENASDSLSIIEESSLN